MSETALEILYSGFQKYIYKVKGYLTCTPFEEIELWEEWKKMVFGQFGEKGKGEEMTEVDLKVLGDICPICNCPLSLKANQFYFRSFWFPGLVCEMDKVLWAVRGNNIWENYEEKLSLSITSK